MSEETKLLFANEAFYAAFAGRDVGAMAAVWADSEPLYCLHPGWPLLSGRKAVMESWLGILSAPGPGIALEAPQAWIDGPVGLVLCSERLGRGLLAATNLFRFEAGRWRLFHHQAGPTQAMAREPAATPRLQWCLVRLLETGVRGETSRS